MDNVMIQPIDWQNGVSVPSDLPPQWQNFFEKYYTTTTSDFDNASNLCHDSISHSCPGDQSAMMIALRWARILIQKVAQTYYGGPLCLMVIPCIFGFILGCLVTRRRIHGPTKKTRKSTAFLSFESIQIVWHYLSSCYLSCIEMVYRKHNLGSNLSDDSDLSMKENKVRGELKSKLESTRESRVDVSLVPKHVAVIMDGNRRYGKKFFPNNPTQGHWDGSKTLVNFCKWCIAEKVSTLTVYAFSTENWNRSPDEVASLMAIFAKYCDELRVEAIQRNIQIKVLSTETERIPLHVQAGMRRMVDETAHCVGGLLLNICLSYGSRGEIVSTCRQLAEDVQKGDLSPDDITESTLQQRLLLPTEPDVVIRTSGEYRISNFLLWQLAYSELFFLSKTWPEVTKQDLLAIIQSFANGRDRRFGK